MKRAIALSLCVATGFLSAGSTVRAQDPWTSRKVSFSKAFDEARKADARVKLVQEIAAAAPATDTGKAELAMVITSALAAELNEKREWEIAGDVLDACEEALRSCTGKKAIEYLVKEAKSAAAPWRIRFHIVRALNRLDDEEVLALLTHLTSDKEARIQVAAIDALATRKDARRFADAFWKAAKDDKISWEPRVAALRALAAAGDGAQVKPLIEYLRGLGKSDGRLRQETADALKALTGQEGGTEASGWEALLAQKNKPVNTPAAGGQIVMTSARPANFYGVTTASTKIFFILDLSGSMKEPASEPPLQSEATYSGPATPKGGASKATGEALDKRKKEWVDQTKAATRIDSAKKELINSIYHLAPAVQFNIITFGDGAKLWMPKLVSASPENKLAGIEYIHNAVADQSYTNTFEALELGMGLGDQKQNYVNALGGADTFYLLSDGAPTGGKLSDVKRILEEVDKAIKVRKVTIHCICLGDPGKEKQYKMDPKFLEDLAKLTGGKFVHVKQ